MLEDIEKFLIAQLAGRIGLSAQTIDIRERFQRYGLDSRRAIEFVAAISAEFGQSLAPTVVWEYPTIEALARHLGGLKPSELAGKEAKRPPEDDSIAIIGMACRFPGASSPEAFWRLLRDGVDAITEVPRSRWDIDAFHDADRATPGKMNTRWGGFLDQVDGFDSNFFGVSPREAVEIDPQQRLMLEVAWEALEDAAVPPATLEGSQTGVFVGAMWTDYAHFPGDGVETYGPHTATGRDTSIISARVSYSLGLQGPSLTVNTACSSSLVAIHLACQSLRSGDSTLALAGGVNLMLAPESTVAMSKFGGLSPEGRCFTFDARANGYVRGEGCGVVVLKRLSEALADGDRVYCIIPGSAVNNDGPSNGLTAPNRAAQEKVVQLALARAGVEPASIQYVEAHGTGTQLGDPIEAKALGSVLCVGRPEDRPLLIGSAKTSIGHLEASAGIAGVIKTVLSMAHRQVPANIHFQAPNPHIAFDELHLSVPTSLVPWPGEGPALAGVNSFGFGGTNAHVVLEAPAKGKRVVFVFSGQGSQWAGMGQVLLANEPVFRATLERCDELVQRELGYSLLAELGRASEESRLGDVEVAWPSIVGFEIALAALWRSKGILPSAVVGHSIGEIAAAHVAGALCLEDAIKVVCTQARLIRRTRGEGAMALVTLTWDDAEAALSAHKGRLVRAIHADPGATVLTGEVQALANVVERLRKEGIFCRMVQGEVAAHSPTLRVFEGELRQMLQAISPDDTRIPFVSSVTASILEGTALGADYWVRNFAEPVLFTDAISCVSGGGHDLFLEVSPHPIVLSSIEAILRHGDRPGVVLPSLRRGEDERAVLQETLGALYALGGRCEASCKEEKTGAAVILPLSAKSPAALSTLARSYQQFLENADASLEDVTYTASVGRSHHECRLALVGGTRDEMIRSLAAFCRGEESLSAVSGRARVGNRSKVVFVFPGQGAQRIGMGQHLLRQEPVFREMIERCDALMKRHATFSLLEELAASEDRSRLHQTEIAQPALFAIEVALAALWRSWGVVPHAVVGHSVGEVAAAYVAGALCLEEATRLVVLRGRVMQQATGQGKMAAVTMSVEEATALLLGYEGRLSIAAHNDPGTVVVSGETDALEALTRRLQMQNVPCRILPVQYAFHSPQMAPLQDELFRALGSLSQGSASLAIYSTVSGMRAEGEAFDAAYWARNIREPVRFADAIGAAIDDGYRIFVEVGPTPVLTANLGQCMEDRKVVGRAIPTLRRKTEERRSALMSLGELYAQGHTVDWKQLYPDGGFPVALPTYPWQRQRYWLERTPSRRGLRDAEDLGHPLLGARVPMAGAAAVFESELDSRAEPFLADHRVFTWTVVPAAAILEIMQVAALAHLGGAHVRLVDLTLQAPLVLRENAPRRIQAILGEDDRVTLYSQLAGARPGGEWKAHATGGVRAEGAQPRMVRLDDLRERCRQETSVRDAYAGLEAVGLHYGPAFQGVKELWRGDDEILARIELPAAVAADAKAYRMHPALLDAAIQAVAMAAQASGVGGLYLPFELSSFAVEVPGVAAAWAHVRVASGSDVVSGELEIVDDEGKVLATILGFRMKRVDAAALRRAERTAPAHALHTLVWQESALHTVRKAPGGSILVFTSGALLGESLARHVSAAGGRCLLRALGEPEEIMAAISEADSLAQPLQGVVFFGDSDRGDLGTSPAEHAEVLAVAGLRVAQALAIHGSARSPRIWWVTRGAQAVETGESVSPAAAVLWGLGRVVAAEQPQLGSTLVDLDPGNDEEAIEALWQEICCAGDEAQIVIRAGKRFVGRLVEASPVAARLAVPSGGGFRLEILQKGTFDKLRLAPAARRTPGPGEVEIRVHASGQNFRDVLNTLGMYPGEAGPLGLECAGEVTAVGEGVHHLSTGDSVMGLALGAFASHVVTDARLVVQRPAGLSFTEAATVPVVFLTAWYALCELGKLRAGERVLIHAAAGGVGMAAVQIAHRLGAEVLATASPSKWALVKAMGVSHVANSRTTGFARAFREATRGKGVDVVLNALAGEFIDESLSLLSQGGRFLEMGKTDLRSPESIAAVHPGVSYDAFDLLLLDPEQIQRMLRALVEGFSAGWLRPLPVRVFTVSEAGAAFEFMARAQHVGKVALIPIMPISAESTVLVTGGVGALGLEVARWLWEVHHVQHILLVGRHAPQGRRLSEVESLRAAGAQITVMQADVSDAAEVHRLISSLHGCPPLRGVFHLAGVLDDGVMGQLTPARFAAVFAPKVRGAWNLHEATRHLPLDVFVMFSSVASLLGNAGQANYAAANAFLDGLAQRRRAEGLPAFSLCWGPWRGDGMAARLDEAHGRFARMGIAALAPAEGVALLDLALARPEPCLGVFPLDVRALIRDFEGMVPSVWRACSALNAVRTERSSAVQSPPRFAALSLEQRVAAMEDIVRGELAKVLALPAATDVVSDRKMREVGLDSLMMVELRNRLASRLLKTFPVTTMYKHSTPAELARFLASLVDDGEALEKNSGS